MAPSPIGFEKERNRVTLPRIWAGIKRRLSSPFVWGTGLLIGVAALIWWIIDANPVRTELSQAGFQVVEPDMHFGLAVDTLQWTTDTIQSGQTLSDILTSAGLSHQRNHETALVAAELFPLTALRAGRLYHLLDDPDTEGQDWFVYEPNAYEYVRVDLQGGGKSERVAYPVEVRESTAGGRIETSLWNAMVGNGYSFELTDKMEDALQWSVDFYHVQVGEKFRLLYERDFIEDEQAGLGRVLAANYETDTKDFYAFWFESDIDTLTGYYDCEGRPMKASFLKSPVRYSRISSSYNLRRFHPILRRTRPHYGTDYAAPYGTPIRAVANGTVTHASRTRGNGNYVKIKHNQAITTQYLHMQGFAPGIRAGTRVSQGEIIGYVGSTGLATGPHVCFRFWKDGKQIDHTKLEFPPAAPLPDSLLPAFFSQRDEYLQSLDRVILPELDTTEVAP
ncbi:MAG: peptidoglycan DD-metalloendopeptidase family protein [Bacteroidota bacterium]